MFLCIHYTTITRMMGAALELRVWHMAQVGLVLIMLIYESVAYFPKQEIEAVAGSPVVLNCSGEFDQHLIKELDWFKVYPETRNTEIYIYSYDPSRPQNPQGLNKKVQDRIDVPDHTLLRINNTRANDSGEYVCEVILFTQTTADKMLFTLIVQNRNADAFPPSTQTQTAETTPELDTLRTTTSDNHTTVIIIVTSIIAVVVISAVVVILAVVVKKRLCCKQSDAELKMNTPDAEKLLGEKHGLKQPHSPPSAIKSKIYAHNPDAAFNIVCQFSDKLYIEDNACYITGFTFIIGTSTYMKPQIQGMCINYGRNCKRWYGKTSKEKEDREETFTLSPGEKIVCVEIRHGALIDQLKFTSNTGQRYGPYGGEGGQEASPATAPEHFKDPCLAWLNGSIVRVEGRESFRNLQFGWVDLQDKAKKDVSEVYASHLPDGEFTITGVFSDKEYRQTKNAFITGFQFIIGTSIYITEQIKGMCVKYNTGEENWHGKREPQGKDTVEGFILEADDRVVSVTIRHGALLDQLTFHTSNGERFGPYGGGGGKEAPPECPPGDRNFTNPCLAWVSGSVVKADNEQGLKNIQFGWIDQSVNQREFYEGKMYATPLPDGEFVLDHHFSDKEYSQLHNAYITGIFFEIGSGIYKTEQIQGMSIHYGDSLSTCHGKPVSDKSKGFNLKNGESITHIDVRSGTLIDQLMFHTSLGNNYGPFGGGAGKAGGKEQDPQRPPKSNARLGWVNGTVVAVEDVQFIKGLQFCWIDEPSAASQAAERKVHESKVYAAHFPDGDFKTHTVFSDEDFSIEAKAYVIGCKLIVGKSVFCQPQIKGIELHYSNEKKKSHGKESKGNEDTELEFTLKDEERITKVDIRHGALLDQLTFHTNLRNEYGPYGGEGGKQVLEDPPSDFRKPCLAWVSGMVVKAEKEMSLKSLQFGWIHLHTCTCGNEHV